MRPSLDERFSRAGFETAADLHALCAQLSEVLTARMRAANNPHLEIEWIVADLRARDHDVHHYEGVISRWDAPKDEPYLWICVLDIDLDEDDPCRDARVSVAFRPQLPGQAPFCCPLCASEMQDQEIWLKIEGHGSAVAPGLQVHFECPGLAPIDDVIGSRSVERRRSVRVCTTCGAALLLPR